MNDLEKLQKRYGELLDYSIDLQKIIEDLCKERELRPPRTTARHHHNMARDYIKKKTSGLTD